MPSGISGSKTYVGVMGIITWIVGMVMNGQLPIMPAIGAALAALTLAALRHGISSMYIALAARIAAAFEGNNNLMIALVAKTVDDAFKKALAENAAAQVVANADVVAAKK